MTLIARMLTDRKPTQSPRRGVADDEAQDFRSLLAADVGKQMHDLVRELFPICRSITGNGLRRTLQRIANDVQLETHEVPSGTQIFDWTVPNEWNIRDAWVKDSSGHRVIDFRENNLHVVNYSIPIRQTMTIGELRPHLHTLPDMPEWIPYRTSYYQENWGFCLTHRQLNELPDDTYEVCIDSSLEKGSLTYGEFLLPGRRQDEVLLSCHACHPSLCNDNLSGVVLVAKLAQLLSTRDLEYSYRFLFIPGTVGAIAWLARNHQRASFIRHGLVVACVGDSGKFHYKRSRRGNAEVDRAVVKALRDSGRDHDVRDFSPYGYDERQYCSPGFNLPVGSLTRTPHGRYPQYHTSADNLDFVHPKSLAESLDMFLAVIDILENNRTFVSRNPHCEPQLGKRGLYRSLGGLPDAGLRELAMLWVLNLSDGTHSMLDIAERSELPFEVVRDTATMLIEHELLEECLP